MVIVHTPYEQVFKHPPDFRVRYRFFGFDEGGRKSNPPSQGYRSDFWYPHVDHPPGRIYMIYPEFEDENGNVIMDKDISVPNAGTATMWILIPEMRAYHRDKIVVGTLGYFMEGPNRVAECQVTEIIGLWTNPLSTLPK